MALATPPLATSPLCTSRDQDGGGGDTERSRGRLFGAHAASPPAGDSTPAGAHAASPPSPFTRVIASRPGTGAVPAPPSPTLALGWSSDAVHSSDHSRSQLACQPAAVPCASPGDASSATGRPTGPGNGIGAVTGTGRAACAALSVHVTPVASRAKAALNGWRRAECAGTFTKARASCCCMGCTSVGGRPALATRARVRLRLLSLPGAPSWAGGGSAAGERG